MKLVVKGVVKQKKNNKRIAYRNGKPFIMTERKTDAFIKDAVQQLKTQFEGHVVTNYPINIQMSFYYATKHRKDIDNSISTILDCLVDAGVIEDDDVNHINEIYGYFAGYDKENPRVEIYLED